MRLIFGAGFLLCMVAVLSFAAFGQIAGGLGETTRTDLGGNNFIVGTVYGPDGTPVTARMRVQLVSMTAGEVSAFTDARGQFIFSGVGAGDFIVRIDREKDFEPISEMVQTNTARGRETFTLSLRLVAKGSRDTKPAVIYAEDANASKNSVALFKEAVALGRAKDHRGAVEKLQAAVADSPKFISALNELGMQYMLLGRLKEAEQPLRTALAINPNAAEPLTNLSILLFRSQRYAEAEQSAKKLLAVNGRSAVGYFYLGRAQIGLDRRDDATKNLLKAVEIGGAQFKEAHLLVATMYHEKGESKHAIEQLEAYLKLAPDASDADKVKLAIKQLRGN